MQRIIPLLFFVILISSCKPSSGLTEKEKLNVVSTAREMFNNYHNDIAKSGLTAEFKYLDSSSEFFWVPPGYSAAISYDSVVTVLKQNAPKFRSIVNAFDSLNITPLTPDLASYTGRLKSTMTDTSGNQLTFFLIETGLLIRRKDGWKLLNGQTAILDQ